VLENKLKSNEESPSVRNREIISKLSKQSESRRQELKKTLLSGGQEEQSMRSVLPNDEYFSHDVSSSRHGLSQGNVNDDSILSKMNALGLENNDNMAMLETDSV
jgi:hypothetical protein